MQLSLWAYMLYLMEKTFLYSWLILLFSSILNGLVNFFFLFFFFTMVAILLYHLPLIWFSLMIFNSCRTFIKTTNYINKLLNNKIQYILTVIKITQYFLLFVLCLNKCFPLCFLSQALFSAIGFCLFSAPVSRS